MTRPRKVTTMLLSTLALSATVFAGGALEPNPAAADTGGPPPCVSSTSAVTYKRTIVASKGPLKGKFHLGYVANGAGLLRQ
ncbi:MAG: hypothetical protein LBJ02_08430 [Bifidobacteriaceae bacterium]|jgi:hypothetical protein|nr:hypothetical protein [Bifidobacteriaceae bacterium]